jgi:hypothetical protein
MAGNRWRRVECLRLLGDINRRDGQMDIARRCYAQGLELARELGVHLEVTRLEDRLRALEDAPPPENQP